MDAERRSNDSVFAGYTIHHREQTAETIKRLYPRIQNSTAPCWLISWSITVRTAHVLACSIWLDCRRVLAPPLVLALKKSISGPSCAEAARSCRSIVCLHRSRLYQPPEHKANRAHKASYPPNLDVRLPDYILVSNHASLPRYLTVSQ
jgi:hypothetical protein